MLIIDVHDMRAEQTFINADPDSVAPWDATTVYKFGDEALFNNVVYYSLENDNANNQPDTEHLKWIAERVENKDSLYDVYPDTSAVKSGSSLIVEWDVTNIDTFFLGNIHGSKVTVDFGGTQYVKNIDTTSISPLQVWGVNSYKEIDDFYIELPTFTGHVKVTVDVAPSDNMASLGFVNYGERKDVGCTLLNTIKYNVRTGVQNSSRGVSRKRVRTQSYEEIILPIKIPTQTDVNPIFKTLAKYRGVPVLIIGDDLGVREETIFHGIYTEIEADIAEYNRYKITLRSLRYESFVPPDSIEALRAKSIAEDKANGTDINLSIDYPVKQSVNNGLPYANEFNDKSKLIYSKDNPCNIYYLDSGTNSVKKCGSKVDSFNGVPTVADFTNSGNDFLFNRLNPCDVYYNNGGTVSKCEPKVNTKAGVPAVADFSNGSRIIIDETKPCDHYYLDATNTVQICRGGIKAYTGVPPLSEFYNSELIYDRSNPCDMYYVDGGTNTVTKCKGGGGGNWGVKLAYYTGTLGFCSSNSISGTTIRGLSMAGTVTSAGSRIDFYFRIQVVGGNSNVSVRVANVFSWSGNISDGQIVMLHAVSNPFINIYSWSLSATAPESLTFSI